MTNDKIKELWIESTGTIWPRDGKFTAGESSKNLLDFAQAVLLESSTERLREQIAVQQLAALTSVYWQEDTANEYATADALIKCHCETAVEYADALIKELNKPKELNND
jgi:hypothetical protein